MKENLKNEDVVLKNKFKELLIDKSDKAIQKEIERIKNRDKNSIFQNMSHFKTISLIEPVIDITKNILIFCTECGRDNDMEFWNILVDILSFGAHKEKDNLLISFNKNDNVYNMFLATRFNLPVDFDNQSSDYKIEFAKRYLIEHPLKLVSINIYNKDFENLESVLQTFIDNNVENIFLKNIVITSQNIKIIEYLQQLAQQKKINLVVLFKIKENQDLSLLNNLKNLLFIKHKKIKNNKTYYFENIKKEKSQHYKIDLKTSSLKVIN